MLKSETDEISGQIFYLTDDNPTNTFFFLDPLYTKINPQAEHCPSVIGIPLPLLCFASLIFHCLSLIMGPKFKMPYWGFTIMEAYKVENIAYLKPFVNLFHNFFFFFSDQRKPLFFCRKSQTPFGLRTQTNKW